MTDVVSKMNRVSENQGRKLRAVSQINPTKSFLNRNRDANSSSVLIRSHKYILQASPHLHKS